MSVVRATALSATHDLEQAILATFARFSPRKSHSALQLAPCRGPWRCRVSWTLSAGPRGPVCKLEAQPLRPLQILCAIKACCCGGCGDVSHVPALSKLVRRQAHSPVVECASDASAPDRHRRAVAERLVWPGVVERDLHADAGAGLAAVGIAP